MVAPSIEQLALIEFPLLCFCGVSTVSSCEWGQLWGVFCTIGPVATLFKMTAICELHLALFGASLGVPPPSG